MMGRRRSHLPPAARARLTLCCVFLAFLLLIPSVPAIAEQSRSASAADALSYRFNLAWLLLAGFLVMFMQLGFALLETGLTRAKNAVNTMAMNLIIYPVGLIGFWLTGYGFMIGG